MNTTADIVPALWIATLADDREVAVEFTKDDLGRDRLCVSLDNGAHCEWSSNYHEDLAKAATIIRRVRGAHVVEWRRGDEPSRAQMRRALEACDDYLSTDTTACATPTTGCDVNCTVLALVRAAVGR